MTSPDRSIIDVDFWPRKARIGDISPYLPDARREWLRINEGRGAELPQSQYFLPGAALKAAEGEDARELVKERLDRAGVESAIVNPGAADSVSGYAHPPLAADMARAVNEWTLAAWLEADDRLRGSIVVGPRDARAAATEIRRARADDKRMAQVLLCYPQQLLGHRSLYPIYEAASELGIPVVLQAGGAYCGSNGGLTTVGDPASFIEAVSIWEYAAQPHLLNVIAQGVFDRYPDLKLVFSGFGVAWVPAVLWRLDTDYIGDRVKAPAVLTKRPSDYVREHISFTTSSLEVPDDPGLLAQLLALSDLEATLLFGSGPSGGEDAEALLGVADPDLAESIFRGTARRLYSFPVRSN